MNEIRAYELLFAGGPAMVPIVFSSIVALTIILKKYRDFARIRTGSPSLKAEIFNLVRDNKIKTAVSYCEENPSVLTRVLKSGLLQFGNSRDEIKSALEKTISFEIPLLSRGLTPLLTIANLAPLFGILGTVLGMILIFQTITTRSASMAPVTLTDVSSGMWQALLSTTAGLIVAIPSFAAYQYFLTRVNDSVHELAQAAEELNQLLSRLNETLMTQDNDVQP